MRTLNRRRWFPVVVMLIVASFVLVAFPRHASASGFVTRGDVEAILHAGPTNVGFHDFLNGHPVPGFDDGSRARISPFSGESGGKHYCVDDWHLIQVDFENVVDNITFFTREQAIADLEAATVTFTLDGVTFPSIRTPIVQLSPNFFDQTAFAFGTGNILSPSALSAGQHTAGALVSDPVFGTFQTASTFIVDPSGTGICLQPLP